MKKTEISHLKINKEGAILWQKKIILSLHIEFYVICMHVWQEVTEICAEAFSVRKENVVAQTILQLIGGDSSYDVKNE